MRKKNTEKIKKNREKPGQIGKKLRKKVEISEKKENMKKKSGKN